MDIVLHDALQASRLSSESTVDTNASVAGWSASVNGASTLAVAQDHVASALAIRTIQRAEKVAGVKVGVASRVWGSPPDSEAEQGLLLLVTAKLEQMQRLTTHLFGAVSAAQFGPQAHIAICSTSPALLHDAATRARTQLMDRLVRASTGPGVWLGTLDGDPHAGAATSAHDADALLHILRRVAHDAAAPPPSAPPPGSRGIDELLAGARARLVRLPPARALEECTRGAPPAVLVDIRPEAQRTAHGAVPGALVVERNVLEWRFDPRSAARLPLATRYDLRVVVLCQEGYTSSLAAASLQDLGLWNATDVEGGFKAWCDEGLPTIAWPNVDVVRTSVASEGLRLLGA